MVFCEGCQEYEKAGTEKVMLPGYLLFKNPFFENGNKDIKMSSPSKQYIHDTYIATKRPNFA